MSDSEPQSKRQRTSNETIPCAKWCRILDNGNVTWDEKKVKCLFPKETPSDSRLLRGVVRGAVLHSLMHPLIFKSALDGEKDSVRLRSLPYFEQLVRDNATSNYQSLSLEQKRIVAVGVRDLFLASRHDLLDEREKRILDGMVKILDKTVGCVQSRKQGISLSFHPSANFKLVKLIEDLTLDENVGLEWEPYFARVMDTPNLFVVFVDPAELSYHNFENIIPLDRWVERHTPGGLSLTLDEFHQVADKREVFTCKLQGASRDLVKMIPSLDLYTEPLNKATRGGSRFIFHSALLSKALSKAVKSSGLLDKLASGKLSTSFDFVNYVFRCNKFAPGDGKFAKHYDTPYYDRSRSHVSKYTLLVYLSKGRGEPALNVSDVNLNDIEEMTCVIFNQRYEHEGMPFIDTEKIFLRTELIFKDEDVRFSDAPTSLFSTACYMTGQSIFDEELASYAHECFERANAMHWGIQKEEAETPVYLYKRFHEMHFLTNGNYYWFIKGEGVTPAACAIVAVLDYFNCKLGGWPFRSRYNALIIRERFGNAEDVWARLKACKEKRSEAKPSIKRLNSKDVESLFKEHSTVPFFKRPAPEDWPSDYEEEDPNHKPCCPYHCYQTFDAWNDDYVLKTYEQCRAYTRQKVLETPVLLLKNEIVLNESNIKIERDKVFFLKGPQDDPIPPVNFAACWNEGTDPAMFVGLDQEIPAPQLLIPPLLFAEFEQGYRFCLDFFRNDWVVSVDDERKIPVPVVTNEVGYLCEESAFCTSVRRNDKELDPLDFLDEEW